MLINSKIHRTFDLTRTCFFILSHLQKDAHIIIFLHPIFATLINSRLVLQLEYQLIDKNLVDLINLHPLILHKTFLDFRVFTIECN